MVRPYLCRGGRWQATARLCMQGMQGMRDTRLTYLTLIFAGEVVGGTPVHFIALSFLLRLYYATKVSYSKAFIYAGEFVGGTPVHFIALGFPAPVILELTSQIAASRREFTEAAAGGGGGVRPLAALALPPSHPRLSF